MRWKAKILNVLVALVALSALLVVVGAQGKWH